MCAFHVPSVLSRETVTYDVIAVAASIAITIYFAPGSPDVALLSLCRLLPLMPGA